MPRPEPTLAARGRAGLLGLALGGRATAEMAILLAEELGSGEIDLRRLADRWIGWLRRGDGEVDEWTRTALEHIAQHDSPPVAMSEPGGAAPLARYVPVALATYRSPRNLVSGTWHVAALVHPDPRCAFGAVAINVAVARFLSGARDFIPDVIEALRNNDAPSVLLAAVRRVPVERWEEIPVNGEGDAVVVQGVERALWAAYHDPALESALRRITTVGELGFAGLVAPLIGARDGDAADAMPLVEPALAERLRGAADRLTGTG